MQILKEEILVVAKIRESENKNIYNITERNKYVFKEASTDTAREQLYSRNPK